MRVRKANSHDFLVKLTLENNLYWASTRSPKLSFSRPEQSRTNQVVDQKITLILTILPCLGLKQRCPSISLNELALVPLLKYLTPSWGFLAVSSFWVVKSKSGAQGYAHLFTDLRSLWSNNFFKEDFRKHGKISQNDSLKALNFYYPYQGSICLQSSLFYIKPLWSSR